VPESFGPALDKLSKGQAAAAPVRSAYGWHILYLEDTKAFAPPSLDEVKNGIRNDLARRKLEARFEALRAESEIQIKDLSS